MENKSHLLESEDSEEIPPVAFGKWTVWITIVSTILFAGLLVLYYVNMFGEALSEKQEVWGQFGDFVGGLMNPVIGMFTLALLLRNLEMQFDLLKQTKAQVRIAREEYKLTREELAKSAEALDKQSRTLRNQVDDAWYFQLLKMRTEMIDRLSLTQASSGKRLVGDECFREWVQELISDHVRPLEEMDSTPRSNDQYASATSILLSLYPNSLYPYLRFVEALVASIDRLGSTDNSAGRKYALLGTQLGEAEATLLGCYAIALRSAKVTERMSKLKIIGRTLATPDRDFDDGFRMDHPVLYSTLQNHLEAEFATTHPA